MPTKCLPAVKWSLFIILGGLLMVMRAVSALPDTAAVVGLFDDTNSDLKYVFDYAISRVNDDDRLRISGTRLDGKKHDVPSLDSFRASKQVCRILHEQVLAVLGPQDVFAAHNIQSICGALQIPHIEARWDFRLRPPNESLSINVYPDYRALSKAYHDIVKLWQWNSFTVLYETNEGIIKLQELLRGATKMRISLRQLKGPDYHDVLKDVRASGESHIILDCAAHKVPDILRQAQQLKLTSPYYQYLLTTLDIHTIDLSAFIHDHTNITAFRLIDPNQANVRNAARGWTYAKITPGSVATVPDELVITTEQALFYDGVMILAKALRNSDVSDLHPVRVSCEDDLSWAQGRSLIDQIAQTELRGLSGRLKFDENRTRTDFHLDIVQILANGPQEVGTWNITHGALITWNYTEHVMRVAASIRNRTLRAITVIEEPYVMLKEDFLHRIGNDRYEGYAVELMDMIALEVGFNYTLEHKDMSHGIPDPKTQEWSGLIRELIDKRADLAVGGITISYNREQVVDFTKPFMHLGISILYRKPDKKPPDLFSFLHPLSPDVWMYMVTAYVAVSITIFVLARFSPYEWYNPHPCNEDGDVVENQFTICNSLWFTVGSLMQQGSDIAPRAVSTRVAAGCWWFFTLIMISSYTANLAAFLTVERMKLPIESAEDLSKQTEIKYGCYYGGATYNFFKDSKLPIYKRMWEFMSQDQANFVKTGKAGINRVKTEKYAYLMETPSLEYTIYRDCDLTQIGSLLDSKGFGIATPQNSPYRDEISKAILKLQESSELQVLKDRWWKEKNIKNGEKCEVSKPQDQASELGLANVGGVFVILLAGLALSFAVAILEFVWKARKSASNFREPVSTEMLRALRFAVRLHGSSKKPVVRPSQDTLEHPSNYEASNSTTVPLGKGKYLM
ncbi:Glutamate receptor ionotropic, kainate 2 [Hypsibius exemplaris]|uniref:Glutamate receptor 1 n=1 Tax=Hypsibius exemplaris TaxID=2072580 RepID=A0A9X6NH46_HYPEX|nr:Glutamate receptor ionotropic, kainate 2 [Hypsibius exemplaris]